MESHGLGVEDGDSSTDIDSNDEEEQSKAVHDSQNGKDAWVWSRGDFGMKTLVNVYAFLMGCIMVYGKAIWNGLDWFGRKLVHLIDHSDFFAGVVWTYAIMTAWEFLTR